MTNDELVAELEKLLSDPKVIENLNKRVVELNKDPPKWYKPKQWKVGEMVAARVC